MKRREFTRKQRAEIVLRATNKDGIVCCEGCGLVLGKKPYQIDHTIPEAFILDKDAKLDIADGKLLGQKCCHAPKTKKDVREVRESDRRRDKDSGAWKSKSPMPGGKASKWKRKMNGQVVPR